MCTRGCFRRLQSLNFMGFYLLAVIDKAGYVWLNLTLHGKLLTSGHKPGRVLACSQQDTLISLIPSIRSLSCPVHWWVAKPSAQHVHAVHIDVTPFSPGVSLTIQQYRK